MNGLIQRVTTGQPLHLLLVEDVEDDAELMLALLSEEGFTVNATRVDTPEGFREALKDNWDLIICDHGMPRFSATEAYRLFRAAQKELPFVIVSGEISEATALEAMKNGVCDYVPKSHLQRLVPVVARELKRYQQSMADWPTALERQKSFAEQCPIALLVVRDGHIVYANPVFQEISGFDEGELAERLLCEFLVNDRHDRQLPTLESLHTGEPSGRASNLWLRTRDGGQRWVEVKAASLNSDERLLVVTVCDISVLKQAHDKLSYLTNYDAVTGLANWDRMWRLVEVSVERTRRLGGRMALLWLGLDRFKKINDGLGYEFGDILLRKVAERLRHKLFPDAPMGRPSSDAFIVLIEDSQGESLDGTIAAVLDLVRQPFMVGEQELFLTASVGVSCFPDHGEGAPELLNAAESAMFAAKRKGRNRAQLAEGVNIHDRSELIELENDLYRALDREEFLLHFQPQVDLRSGEMVGVEALLRWEHPRFGRVPPDRFIPLAEESGEIVRIGAWVLRQACQQAREWERELCTDFKVAVNLSGLQFRHDGLLDTVRLALEESGLPPGRLELELTEGVLIANTESAVRVLRQLQETGVRTSVDDFGTGYSSLSYLKQFPLSTLKIDRSFVKDIPHNPRSAAVASAILELGRKLEMDVIAEGVEDRRQLQLLREMGCSVAQGFLFSAPVAPSALRTLLRQPFAGMEPASN